MESNYPANREWYKNIKFNNHLYRLRSIYDDNDIDINDEYIELDDFSYDYDPFSDFVEYDSEENDNNIDLYDNTILYDPMLYLE